MTQSIESMKETIAAQAAVIELYEQALIASWPEGAMGDAFDYWNKARAATDSTQILDEVRRAERERAAVVAEKHNDYYGNSREIAGKIRAME